MERKSFIGIGIVAFAIIALVVASSGNQTSEGIFSEDNDIPVMIGVELSPGQKEMVECYNKIDLVGTYNSIEVEEIRLVLLETGTYDLTFEGKTEAGKWETWIGTEEKDLDDFTEETPVVMYIGLIPSSEKVGIERVGIMVRKDKNGKWTSEDLLIVAAYREFNSRTLKEKEKGVLLEKI